MRILVATDQWFPDLLGGSARVATETARELARRGHEITTVAPKTGGLPRIRLEDGVTVVRALPRSDLIPKTFSDVVATALEGRRLHPDDFDLLVAHQCTTALGLVALRPRTPLAVVFHAPVAKELAFLAARLDRGPRRLAFRLFQPLLRSYERIVLPRAAEVLLLSEFSRSLLREDHPAAAERARRVSGGVDVGAFTPGDGMAAARRRLGLEEGGRLLLTVRRLEPRMGLENLLRTLPLLPEREATRLAVVGSGMIAERLRELARELGVADRVQLIGPAGDETLRDWYRAADVFVLPTVAYEGFGMVTAEALASGTPVVGTPVGATPELLEPLEPALLARGTEPAALAEAITNALALAGAGLGERCRSYACERFAWERAIVPWEEAFSRAAGQSSTLDGTVLDVPGAIQKSS